MRNFHCVFHQLTRQLLKRLPRQRIYHQLIFPGGSITRRRGRREQKNQRRNEWEQFCSWATFCVVARRRFFMAEANKRVRCGQRMSCEWTLIHRNVKVGTTENA